MKRLDVVTGSVLLAATLLSLGGAGCAFRVVQPPDLVIADAQGGEPRVVKYPSYVLVHDAGSFWDLHQIKENLVGFSELDIVHGIDLAVTWSPDHHPVENGVEWIKNNYAQLPDCAPVRIVGGLFGALQIEKLTILSTVEIDYDPGNPIAYVFFTRVIYLTEWVHETLGEVNTAAGYVAPWPGPFVPRVVTAPISRGVHWAQRGAVTGYIYVFRNVNLGLDYAVDGLEAAESGVVAGSIYFAHEVTLGTSFAWKGGRAAWGGVTGIFLHR